MNSKNIKKHLNAKMKDWVESIDDANIKSIIKNNTIITGGALVSLLTGEPANDYDVYFRTKDAALMWQPIMLTSGMTHTRMENR